MPGLDLENVREIALNQDFQVEMDVVRSMIGQFEILVNAAVDVSVDRQGQSAAAHAPILSCEFSVDQEDFRVARAGRAAIEKFPWLTVRINQPLAHQPRVVEEQALGARAADLPVDLGE